MKRAPLAIGIGVLSIVSALGAAARVAGADESTLTLIDAPGRDVVRANCITCHSIDYLLMNAGIADRQGLEASITKMRKVMHAPISDADAAVILDYLTQHYGKPGR